jgi:quercetin dioxygenase-like cupin family protein
MASKFIPREEVKSDSPPWGVLRFICAPSSTDAKNLTIIEGVVKPGMGHDFHRHPTQEEIIYVVSGSIEQWVEQEKRMLGPGEAVFIEPGTVHASFNAGSGEAKIIAIFGPSVGEAGLETEEMADQEPWRSLRT